MDNQRAREEECHFKVLQQKGALEAGGQSLKTWGNLMKHGYKMDSHLFYLYLWLPRHLLVARP